MSILSAYWSIKLFRVSFRYGNDKDSQFEKGEEKYSIFSWKLEVGEFADDEYYQDWSNKIQNGGVAFSVFRETLSYVVLEITFWKFYHWGSKFTKK